MTINTSTWVVFFETCVTDFVSCLTFLDLLLFVILAGSKQSEDDASLRVEADGWHHHPAWSFHYVSPWGKIQKESQMKIVFLNCHCVTAISLAFYRSNLFFSCVIDYFKKTPFSILLYFSVTVCWYYQLVEFPKDQSYVYYFLILQYVSSWWCYQETWQIFLCWWLTDVAETPDDTGSIVALYRCKF